MNKDTNSEQDEIQIPGLIPEVTENESLKTLHLKNNVTKSSDKSENGIIQPDEGENGQNDTNEIKISEHEKCDKDKSLDKGYFFQKQRFQKITTHFLVP